MIKIVKKIWNDNLYRNSIYLILNSAIMALLGFFFWTIAARNFSSYDVGLATTVISAINIIMLFSMLGFNISFLRYLPKEKEKGRIIFTGLFFASIVNVILALVFVLGIEFFSPKLSFLVEGWQYILLFLGFSLVWLLFMLTNSILIAKRRSLIVLVKSTIYSLVKLVFVFLFTGFFGLLVSWYLSIFMGLLFCVFFFKVEYKFDFEKVKKMFKFSSYNYFSHLFFALPGFVLPLIVTQYLDPSYTAYFYVAWMISNLILVVPTAVGQNLLTEGSYDEADLSAKFKKALIFSLAIVLFGIFCAFVLGKFLLGLFSTEYLLGLNLLYVLALAAIPYTFNQVYISLLNVQHKIKKVVLINLTVALITIVGSILVINSGLIYIGFVWLFANIVAMVWRWI